MKHSSISGGLTVIATVVALVAIVWLTGQPQTDADDPHAHEQQELSRQLGDAMKRIAELESGSMCFTDLGGWGCWQTEIGCLCHEIPAPMLWPEDLANYPAHETVRDWKTKDGPS